MQGYDVQQSTTAFPLVFLLISSTDHITGLTGATVTVTLSKSGGAFASPSGGVTEIANGWYKVAGNATDTGTLGPLALHATASGADPTDALYPVVSYNPQSSTAFITSIASVGTLTTYTGNTPQTGDSFARIGSTGSGLTSVAQASTALSSAQWTPTRAGYLDNLSAGPVALASGVIVAAAGLDGVTIEFGLNARQALCIIAAANAGTSSGSAAGSPVYTGAGVATTRITATASNGDRSAVTLHVPS